MKTDYPWMVQHFEENRRGRDFVAGDIHGEFTVLENALENIDFDFHEDRLFCVGDLIDRGPQSSRIIEFLNYQWFHSIAGNHEWMLYNCHNDKQSRQSLWYPNGGGWWEGISTRLRDDILEAIHSRQHALITVRVAGGSVGLVHALTHPFYSWSEFCQKVCADQVLQQWALWERDFQAFSGNDVAGIDQVFCGHTPMNQVHAFSNFINIDSGCGHRVSHWLSDPALTLVELSSPLNFYRFPTDN